MAAEGHSQMPCFVLRLIWDADMLAAEETAVVVLIAITWQENCCIAVLFMLMVDDDESSSDATCQDRGQHFLDNKVVQMYKY